MTEPYVVRGRKISRPSIIRFGSSVDWVKGRLWSIMDISHTNGIDSSAEFIRGVSAIASAYLANNPTDAKDIPALIREVSNALKNAVVQAGSPGKTADVGAPSTDASLEGVVVDRRKESLPTEPAVPIAESVTHNAIICLFDGVPKKMLKRYIRANYGMEEDEYRAYWGLPADYPMVAPSYAEQKSRVAVSQGLGTSKIDKTPRAERDLSGFERKVA